MKNDLKRLLVKSSSYSNWFLPLRNVWCDQNQFMGRSLILGRTAFEDEYEAERRS